MTCSWPVLYLYAIPPTCLTNPPFFATTAFSHNTTRADFMEGLGLLTAARVRDIRFPLSWRPASADHGHEAKLPEN
jgi:hypothetical protein